MSSFRLAYLVSHPIQYQAPLLRRLAANPALDLTVFFLSDASVRSYHDVGFGQSVRWDVPLLDGYSHVFLRGLGRRHLGTPWLPIPLNLESCIARGHFDALWVHGYAHLALLRGIRAAWSAGIRVLVRGESHRRSRPRGVAGRLIRRLLLPRFFARIDACLAIGSLNREYYLQHGVAAERIFPMPYAVDNESFQKRAAECRPRREEFRRELDLEQGRPVILFAAKMLRRKRPLDLLEAYLALSPDGRSEPRPYLLFVGDGSERPMLQARTRATGWSSVRFLGFRNQSELPSLYDLADVFVLPSEHEPWGLAVNEAMNAAKPVIVSDRVGAAADLVRQGENGFVVPFGSIGDLAEALRRTLADPDQAAAMGRASLERIRSFSFAEDEAGLLEALRTVCRGAPRSQANTGYRL